METDFGRTDDVDHDLLTFSEAAARLRENIAEEQRRIAELESADGDGSELARARKRLAALEEGFERNTERRINEKNFQDFFGFS